MTPEEILKMAHGFMESKILHAAAQLDIFTIVSQTPLTAQEVADRIGGDLKAIATLMDAVAAMRLLDKTGNKYHCDSSLLVAGAPGSVLPMVLHMSHLWDRWSNLVDIAKGIRTPKEEFNFSHNAEELRAFIGAMHSIGAPLAQQIVASINPGSARSLLDVGGGSGTYTIAFLRAVPGLRAALFDLPGVIAMAWERFRSEGLLDRVTLFPGNYFKDDLPQGFDTALLSAIIHSNSLEENLQLYKKICRSLNPGGRLLIRDHVMSPDRTHPREGAAFAINMLVGTSGSCYTFEEIENGLKAAGFSRIRLLRQGEHMDAVVEAWK
jgi:SAM-dependent methyltransferase